MSNHTNAQTELQEPQTITVTARGLAVGGTVACRVTGPDGSPLVGVNAFVPFVVPGEVAQVRVTQQYARYAEGEVAEVVTPSPDRAEPACPYFGECGGCDIQHISYEAGLGYKREMVQGAFRSGGLGEIADLVRPVVPSPPYGYRRRVTLHVGADGSLGYFRRHSHSLLPVATCPISVPTIDALLASGFNLSGLWEPTDSEAVGKLEVNEIERGLYGFLSFNDVAPPMDSAQLQARMESVFVDGAAYSLSDNLVVKLHEANKEASREANRRAAPGAFSQVNGFINQALVQAVCDAATGAKTAYDLYAGDGNFALPLAKQGVQVIAVEINPVSVERGLAFAKERELENRVTFEKGMVERWLRDQKQIPSADFTVADPSRTGLGKSAAMYTFSKRLALISCHLPSAVRDIAALQKMGWRVQSVQPFDMFAQTNHLELLTVLDRD